MKELLEKLTEDLFKPYSEDEYIKSLDTQEKLDAALMEQLDAGDGFDVPLIKRLILAGANIDLQGDYEETPLMRAIDFGELNLVKWLVQHGADTTIEDFDGDTAEEWAMGLMYKDIAKYLASVKKFRLKNEVIIR